MTDNEMSDGRHTKHRGRPHRSSGWLGFVVLTMAAALLLALVGVLVWAAVFNQHDAGGGPTVSAGPNPATSPHAGHTASPTRQSQPSVSVTPLLAVPLAACVAEVAATDAEVDAARVGIGHWIEHIQARTDLLSGAKSEEVTKAIWKRTREAGPADLTRYQQAVAEHAQRSGACVRAARSSRASSQLSACQLRLRVLNQAVAAGAAGMGDWKAHQDAMAAHKAGEIDSAHAQTMWVAAWTAAPKNINAFKAADAVLRTAPACR
jgi:hypothetical protein